jgi:hypothetical protein
MGGSGGGGYIPRSSESIRRRIEEARAAERERLDSEVNRLLRAFLARVNDRDADKTRAQLEELQATLGESIAVQAMLFGGSVAKHTYVDGLSDVDALVVLDREGTRGLSPQNMLDDFHRTLDERLSRARVESVEKGTLAVTVRFRDGSEVQLLPAVRKGSQVAIPDASGRGWRETDPRRFQRELSRQNERLGRVLVPTIKLVKSLVGDLPRQQRISGYHAEALCLDAAKKYRGETTPKALLSQVLDHASRRVLRPIQDVTGQSRTVDADLGPADSARRRLVSQALGGIRRRLEAATSLHQWKAMFGRVEE